LYGRTEAVATTGLLLLTCHRRTLPLQAALSDDEYDSLTQQLAMNPEAGAVIPNSGGLRKLRFGCKGKGKSGGLRVVYFFYDLNMPLFVIAAYEKGKVGRYTEKELAVMRAKSAEIVVQYAGRIKERAGSAA
jgi:hypothetical protein